MITEEYIPRVAVFVLKPTLNTLVFLETFSTQQEAEQWITKTGSENRKYIILPFMTGGNENVRI